jgi:signal transduction histidine kinase/nitrate/nitrite-specific signal transduction histidine kinase
VVTDLERRIQELNVLSRLSQGINITLNFDDILELIYTQTTHLISVSDFRITLYDQVGEYYYHVFYLEDDKRLNDREGGPLRDNHGLVKVVHQEGRWIVTDDYARECRSRGILPEDEGVYAWIGIPLSAGDENIGVLSLASRNPADFFTDEQVRLLQAIADLAAGAIIKARLLEESERRSRQMEMLNDLGRSLTSTLDVSPLMSQILESAVDILNAESGALFMINEESGDLIFQAVTDPISRRLIGRRLPQGSGYVGEVAKSGLPVIINDAPKTEDWVATIEDDLIFETKDLLLVPMQVKDRITGMIEIINKRDGSPFTIGDQELLTAFTGQAAVALENARLYTLTDQKLADRVDELFVMQRIDRELNDRLDVDRAMHITLDWAMNQSDADAGLVGMLEDGKVRVMAFQGYDSELDAYPESLLPLNSPALRNAIYQEITQQLDVSGNGEGFGLLTNATSQVVIPIRREDKVIGILMLETRRINPWGEDIQAFLSRLSDHAAIAIANARLYAEVQEANLAKTEFVSLVSHELKTPMTSIKGYTDLLLGGAVGSVSEAQANFLHTIRTNVNRMDDLVSDLADVSRIEAGRLRLDFEAVAVGDVVEDVLHTTQREIETQNLDLEVRVPDDLPRVWGDRTRLVQVLTNLLSNAYKYTPNGGSITMQARQTPNQWDPNGAPEVVHISIADTGIGIKSEEQVHIFQKFFRCEDPRVREVPGTGLGLNITKYLVEMQGGKIWFESELDQGTTFHITVPVSET